MWAYLFNLLFHPKNKIYQCCSVTVRIVFIKDKLKVEKTCNISEVF